MKAHISLAALISTAALTGGVLLASMSPTHASPCPFSKAKGATSLTSVDFPTQFSKKLGLNPMAIAGAGIATVAGLFAAGIAYKSRYATTADVVLSEVPLEHPEVPSDANSDEFLYPPTPEEASFSSTADRDLTAVR